MHGLHAFSQAFSHTVQYEHRQSHTCGGEDLLTLCYDTRGSLCRCSCGTDLSAADTRLTASLLQLHAHKWKGQFTKVDNYDMEIRNFVLHSCSILQHQNTTKNTKCNEFWVTFWCLFGQHSSQNTTWSRLTALKE